MTEKVDSKPQHRADEQGSSSNISWIQMLRSSLRLIFFGKNPTPKSRYGRIRASFDATPSAFALTLLGATLGAIVTLAVEFVSGKGYLFVVLATLAILLLIRGAVALESVYRATTETAHAVEDAAKEAGARFAREFQDLSHEHLEDLRSLNTDYEAIAKELEKLYGRISWTPHESKHDQNVFDKMEQLLHEPGIIALDVFTILRDLGNPKRSPSPYYETIDKLLEGRPSFRYRRILINRLEPLGHYLANRQALWDHLHFASNFSDIRHHHASERRLFDISFGLFYVRRGEERIPRSLVLEISQWGVAGQILGLLEIRGSRDLELLKAFESTFELVRTASRPINLEDLKEEIREHADMTGPAAFLHIIYEIRKDCLVGLDRLERWVGTLDRMVAEAVKETDLAAEEQLRKGQTP